MANQLAGGSVLRPVRLCVQLRQLPNVVQHGPGDDERLAQRRLHVGIVCPVLVRQMRRELRHRQDMLQIAAPVGVMVSHGGRDRFDLLGMLGEDLRHQLPQRRVVDLRLHQVGQFGEHLVGVESAAGIEGARIEPVRPVFVRRGSHPVEVDLRTVLALAVAAAELEELARLPSLLAVGEEGGVSPDHGGDDSIGVAEAAPVVGLAVSRGRLLARGQEREAVPLLARFEFREAEDAAVAGFGKQRRIVRFGSLGIESVLPRRTSQVSIECTRDRGGIPSDRRAFDA